MVYYADQADFLQGKPEKGYFMLWDPGSGLACKVNIGLPAGTPILTGKFKATHGFTLMSPGRVFLIAARNKDEMDGWMGYLGSILDLEPLMQQASLGTGHECAPQHKTSSIHGLSLVCLRLLCCALVC